MSYPMVEKVVVKTIKVLLFIMCLSGTCLMAQGDATINQVNAALAAGNAVEISRAFNSMVDLTLPGTEDTFSKTQAERILQEFFRKYPVKSYKPLKNGASGDGSLFSIGKLFSGNTVFRVYYLIKKVSGKNLIQQLQITEEK